MQVLFTLNNLLRWIWVIQICTIKLELWSYYSGIYESTKLICATLYLVIICEILEVPISKTKGFVLLNLERDSREHIVAYNPLNLTSMNKNSSISVFTTPTIICYFMWNNWKSVNDGLFWRKIQLTNYNVYATYKQYKVLDSSIYSLFVISFAEIFPGSSPKAGRW